MEQPRTTLGPLTMMAPPARPGPERPSYGEGAGKGLPARGTRDATQDALPWCACLYGALVTSHGRDVALYHNLGFSMVYWRTECGGPQNNQRETNATPEKLASRQGASLSFPSPCSLYSSGIKGPKSERDAWS